MTQRLVQDEDELLTFVNIQSESTALFITGTYCLCERSLKRALMLHKPLETGSPFLLSAIMSQSKLKPNHKLVLSQIQLTDSLPLCFFEKPLMLAGGFCTHSDGNE